MSVVRSPLRVVLGIAVGLVLAIGLHACQPSLPMGTTSPDSAIAPADAPTLEKALLPPDTQAIAQSVQPSGLYDPPRGDVRLVVFSDLNSAYGSTNYEPEVKKAITLLPFWQPDMVVCGGDMVAGQSPSLTEQQLRAMWVAFDQQVAAPLRNAKVPFGFTLGNHDASSAKSGAGKFLFEKERAIAKGYWNAPSHDPGVEFVDRDEFPFYYTFKYKDIFFLTWDGSSNVIPPEKLAWVEKALQSPAAQAAKLKILLGHLPLYGIAVGRDKAGEVMDNADQLRAMLERNNVHTYISGHQHAYYPAHKGKLQLLHSGLLGAGARPYVNSKLPPRKALTVIDINFDSPNLTTYTTYDMKSLRLIEFEELPRYIIGHNGIVLRRDVEMEDLSASEKAACANRIGADRCRA
jgi:hypothetical protein